MIDALGIEISGNSTIESFIKKLNNGKVTESDVSLYGTDLGECIAKNINKNIRSNMLLVELNEAPVPLLEAVHEKVVEAASIVQAQEDKKDKIGFKPVKPDFPKQKIHDLIFKTYKTLKEQEMALNLERFISNEILPLLFCIAFSHKFKARLLNNYEMLF